MAHSDLTMPYIVSYGTPEQKSKYIPGMVSGEIVGAIALTEPSAGRYVSTPPPVMSSVKMAALPRVSLHCYFIPLNRHEMVDAKLRAGK